MSLNTLLFTVSEAAVPDARQLMTLVAVEPGTWLVQEIGAMVAPFVTLVAEDDEVGGAYATPGQTINLRVSVSRPNGDAVFLNQAAIAVQPKVDPELPMRIQMISPLPFAVPETGDYRIQITASAPDRAPTTWERILRVRLPAGGVPTA